MNTSITLEEANYLLHQEISEKDSLLNKFIYSCSHDLKGPLASIKGLIYLAERSPQSDNTKECLQLINESVLRMDHCLKSLEALMGNSWDPVCNTDIDLLEIINRIIDEHLVYIKANDIKLNIRVMQAYKVTLDAGRVQLIISHLVQNALIFQKTSRPQKLVDIDVKVLKENVQIEICDNGEGIAKEDISRIFNIFYRSSEASKGSGLGLYIVKETVAKLKGNISVRSSKGVGSNFVVNIPLT